ncbi:MAG: hypothetical protein HXY40_15315 [Chloroflexi bacterium]|nr:hypothetical protein [Chloroflexota bacterium]
MFNMVYAAYGVIHFGLLFWAARLYVRRRSLGLALLMLVLAGLVYDNGIIAAGSSVGMGETLRALNVPRFLLHALLTPTFIITTLELAQRAGVGWLQKPLAQRGLWAATVLLAVVGLFTGVIGMELYPACFGGTLRYAERVAESQLCFEGQEVHAGGIPPLAAIGTIVLVLVIAIAIWRKNGWYWLLLGAAAMLIAGAVPASRVGPWVGSAGEVVLALALLVTEAKWQRGTVAGESAPQLQMS